MQKTAIIILTIIILGFIIGIVSISGCINTNQTNNTWGEKKISLDAITIANNITSIRSEVNESRYYVDGYIENKNPYEAINVKISVTTYYANGTVFAVNNTPYMDVKNLPANGGSFFYARFEDPDKKIARFEAKIVSAQGEY
ncbi:MAG: hypothetical protein ABFC34_10390 [Methanobacterium sp.]